MGDLEEGYIGARNYEYPGGAGWVAVQKSFLVSDDLGNEEFEKFLFLLT